jgi:DNA invertase Pin-like site-specific DNA recombinase
MIYGYLRVSSDEQDVSSQKQGVEQFAKDKGWTIDKFITDEGVSGGKDPDKRNLGPLLKLVNKDDVIISSEISRLGRDLYMVMDILHLCMERGCIIYTVKDRFVLGSDIQSKVLAFAFGLSAEIERQMIRQRTKEGLQLRVKMGVLVGRPLGTKTEPRCDKETKEKIIEQYKWGVPLRRLAENFKVDRNTVDRWLTRWGCKSGRNFKKEEEQRRKRDTQHRKSLYKDDDEYCNIELPREIVIGLIEQDLTIPQIAENLPQYTYEQIYDTILCDYEFNALYRKHGQLKVKKK